MFRFIKRIILLCLTAVFIIYQTNANCAPRPLKKLVAVEAFENKAGVNSEIELGTGMADMLTDALIQSGYFIVMERQAIKSVLQEQDFAASGRAVQAEDTAQIGKISPVQVLIRGAVTEFEIKEKNDEGLNVRGFNLNVAKSVSHVAVVIRLIDTTTGEVIDSQRVDGDAEEGGLEIGFSGHVVNFDQANFKRTPVGKACQLAIDKAVDYIVRRMSEMPWHGKIAAVKDGAIVINSGMDVGIKNGDRFEVLRKGQEFFDPDTGMTLGSDLEKIGEVEVVLVENKYSKAKPIMGQGFKPKDILRSIKTSYYQNNIIDQYEPVNAEFDNARE